MRVTYLMTFNPQPKTGKKKKNIPAIPQNIVKAVLIRDRYTCQYTGKTYSPEQHALHIHHRIFKKMGRSQKIFNMLDNLVCCDWERHSDHGSLKHARILSETNDDKINELKRRYK
jgi:5-methylcytosine-specific restriction endonuclease McrA